MIVDGAHNILLATRCILRQLQSKLFAWDEVKRSC